MLTEIEREKSARRSNQIDYDRLTDLHYVGNYVRRLPTNMTRMMENAHDWEHLPFVHASSFSSIDLVESGSWGWRARIGVPGGIEPTFQMLDLLVDMDKNYWVSTVFHGPGEGIEIHTQATPVNDAEIEVDIRFFLPDAPDSKATSDAILTYMTAQYKTLYDEDIDLMQGRQSALEERHRWRAAAAEASLVRIGALSDLDPDAAHTVETRTGRFCVRRWQGQWHAHSATCPHLLGPLNDSKIDADGLITCPWHGYRFQIATGQNVDGTCTALKPAPNLVERDGILFLAAD